MVAWIEAHAPADILHREGITAKRICELAQQGDAVALQAVEHEALYLGLGLANLINLFTPDAIVLSGSVMKSAALFLDRIRAVIRGGCRFVPAEKTQLMLASLGEDTNLIGAARVWHYRFGRRPPLRACHGAVGPDVRLAVLSVRESVLFSVHAVPVTCVTEFAGRSRERISSWSSSVSSLDSETERTRRVIVGVPKESYPGERRVALVPVVIPNLIKAGLEVVVEAGAGRAGRLSGRSLYRKGREDRARPRRRIRRRRHHCSGALLRLERRYRQSRSAAVCAAARC